MFTDIKFLRSRLDTESLPLLGCFLGYALLKKLWIINVYACMTYMNIEAMIFIDIRILSQVLWKLLRKIACT